ncbi:interferon alpha/beta receptor 2-like isoform X2 [Gymnodraco acuticeps]|uniref:Interferon alpha/beta receptor 2-like isoform X2 n=1 Tax=Gymnodraco acuticeps TaxID=8218 RepID=A0A6P8ULS5_GYMAC|nr:interferon alpha/beta receptor 2-like isoform X2 [Gymnodraco acuticeps]
MEHDEAVDDASDSAATPCGVCVPPRSFQSLHLLPQHGAHSQLPAGPRDPPRRPLHCPGPPPQSQWRLLAACTQLTAGQKCNLTRAFKDRYEQYQARIQAFTLSQTSNWTVSEKFLPLTDTVLGPPDVSLSGCGDCLLLRLGAPIAMEFSPTYRVHVQRTRDGVQFNLSLPYKEETVITYLQPGVEYCVTVSIWSVFNKNTVSSAPHCAFTSPPPSRISYVVMLGLLAAVCALGLLLILLHFYGLQGFKVLRKCLSTTLCGGGVSIEQSAQMSAVQHLKEGSADCLLTAQRLLRNTSDGERKSMERTVKSNV